MKLTFHRKLACPPDVAFTWVSDAESMNRWSEARVEPRRLGDGSHPAGVGARRDIHLPPLLGQRQVLREVVLESEPASRFVYSVVGGAPVRHHEGQIELTPDGAETSLHWTVEIELAHPLMAGAVRRTLVPSLERSLDTLARIASSGQAVTPPPRRQLDTPEETAAALLEARATLRAQEQLMSRLADDDPCRWFVQIYVLVTEELIERVVEKRVRHPAWVLRLVPRFHAYFADALGAEHPEAHWADAFRKMQSAAKKYRPLKAVGYVILQGMRAHIDEDLPRALASVYRDHYAGRCDYARFRGEYLCLVPAFARASERMLDLIPDSYWRLSDRLARRVPPELRSLRKPRGYDLLRARNAAFERGERIANVLIAPSDA